MKKHLKILATLGLTVPLALSSSGQTKNGSSNLTNKSEDGSQIKTEDTNGNLVLNRISHFAIETPSINDSGHVNVHNDNQPHTDHHTDRTSSVGDHTDYHSDSYGSHTDKHIDTGDTIMK